LERERHREHGRPDVHRAGRRRATGVQDSLPARLVRVSRGRSDGGECMLGSSLSTADLQGASGASGGRTGAATETCTAEESPPKSTPREAQEQWQDVRAEMMDRLSAGPCVAECFVGTNDLFSTRRGANKALKRLDEHGLIECVGQISFHGEGGKTSVW